MLFFPQLKEIEPNIYKLSFDNLENSFRDDCKYIYHKEPTFKREINNFYNNHKIIDLLLDKKEILNYTYKIKKEVFDELKEIKNQIYYTEEKITLTYSAMFEYYILDYKLLYNICYSLMRKYFYFLKISTIETNILDSYEDYMMFLFVTLNDNKNFTIDQKTLTDLIGVTDLKRTIYFLDRKEKLDDIKYYFCESKQNIIFDPNKIRKHRIKKFNENK